MKFVVYTVLTGDKENLRNPFPENFKNYERVCFTDNPNIKSKDWDVVLIDNYYLGSERESRRVKLRPHEFLENFDYSLYIDNTVSLKIDPLEILHKYATSSFVCFSHPFRDCIYEEGEEVIAVGYDDEIRVREQLDFYQSQGYPYKMA